MRICWQRFLALILLLSVSLLNACSSMSLQDAITDRLSLSSIGFAGQKYDRSGTLIISKRVPIKISSDNAKIGQVNSAFASTAPTPSSSLSYGAFVSYIPPVAAFLPADNEVWIEISAEAKTLTLYRGSEIVKRIAGDGQIDLEPGVYALQHKQRNPLWYAPDSYFLKRRQSVPAAEDHTRYRKGALGEHVIYASTTFAIHSASLWDSDVGGMRIKRNDLSSIYYMIPIGATIVVK
ncbi:MAG: L,D-transpeptidase [Deltaproteobacteria bacterium]|nr:L,D-transpeptidase [Deltaproteobacteria bacterium]